MKTYSSSKPAPLLLRVAAQLLSSGERVLTDKSTAIMAITGLAALLAALRLALASETTSENLFQTWMVDWIVVWAALAMLVFFMLKPLFTFLKSDRQSFKEAVLLRQMALLEPNLAQELRTLGMYQQRRDEEAAENALELEASLAPLGSLTAAPSRRTSGKDLADVNELSHSVNRFSPAA